MIRAIIGHLVALPAGIFISGVWILLGVALTPLIRTRETLYPILLGLVGVVEGASRLVVAGWVLGWFGFAPSLITAALMGLASLPNDLRRTCGAILDPLRHSAERNSLVGHLLGVALATPFVINPQ